MKAVRMVVLGFLMVGALTWVGVSAAQVPSGQAPPTPGVPTTTRLASPNSYFQGMRPAGHPDQLQARIAQLAQQFVKETNVDKKKEIRGKLTEALGQQFDQRIQQQQKELEELEKQVASLKAVLKKRLDAKPAIVDRRIEQLLQEAEGLGWNAPGSPRLPGGGLTPGFIGSGGFSGFAPVPAPGTAPAKPPSPQP